VRIAAVILLLNVGAMVLLVLVDALVRPARVLVAVAAADDPARSLLPRLLGVGPILAGPHSGIRTHDLALNPKQRLVDLDKLIDQVSEPLFVVAIGWALHLLPAPVAFKILCKHLLKILV
jgi:hypothetical protein